MMHLVAVNTVGRAERRQLNGRWYLVAPLTLIVPGVLEGSKGRLLYPPDEVALDTHVWNMMPLVLNHPYEDGQPISARMPLVLEKYWLGWVFNALYQDNELQAEGWFDEEATKKRDIRVYNALLEGKPIELSTGLFTKDTAYSGTYNDKQYDFVARNYKPDHVAILPDAVGACSLRDGCGVFNCAADKPCATCEDKMNKLSFWQRIRRYLTLQGLNVGELPAEVLNDEEPADNSVTVNEESSMAALTANDKKAKVDFIVANSGVFKDSRATVEKWDDETLTKVHAQVERDVNNQAVANAALQGFKDGNNTYAFDAKEGRFVRNAKKAKANADEEEEEEEEEELEDLEEEEEEPKPKAVEKVYSVRKHNKAAKTNARDQAILNAAKKVELQERKRLMGEILASIKNEKKREATFNKYKDASIDKLEEVLAIVGNEAGSESTELDYADFSGAAGGPVTRNRAGSASRPSAVLLPTEFNGSGK